MACWTHSIGIRQNWLLDTGKMACVRMSLKAFKKPNPNTMVGCIAYKLRRCVAAQH
jgi:hypothetical protein